MASKLIPYTVYLPEEHYDSLRVYAKKRKASAVIRDAICSFLEGNDQYLSGYNKALKDAVKKVNSNSELKPIALNSKTIGQIVAGILNDLEK
jgi:hypothetical protein